MLILEFQSAWVFEAPVDSFNNQPEVQLSWRRRCSSITSDHNCRLFVRRCSPAFRVEDVSWSVSSAFIALADVKA